MSVRTFICNQMYIYIYAHICTYIDNYFNTYIYIDRYMIYIYLWLCTSANGYKCPLPNCFFYLMLCVKPCSIRYFLGTTPNKGRFVCFFLYVLIMFMYFPWSTPSQTKIFVQAYTYSNLTGGVLVSTKIFLGCSDPLISNPLDSCCWFVYKAMFFYLWGQHRTKVCSFLFVLIMFLYFPWSTPSQTKNAHAYTYSNLTSGVLGFLTDPYKDIFGVFRSSYPPTPAGCWGSAPEKNKQPSGFMLLICF